jgi:BirA family biotin operon repressor/biotin-[acetyl-CoA-carboxylase] ligase
MPAGGTSVLMETGREIDRDELMRSFLDQLDVRYRELRQDDLHDRWDQVQGKLAMRGELVSVIDGDAVVTGCLAGIDTTGALLLQTDDPHPRRIVVGDLIRGPRPIKNADN